MENMTYKVISYYLYLYQFIYFKKGNVLPVHMHGKYDVKNDIIIYIINSSILKRIHLILTNDSTFKSTKHLFSLSDVAADEQQL
jgi:hypothetical protein